MRNKSNSLLWQLSDRYRFSTSVIVTFEIEIGIKSEQHQQDYDVGIQNVQVLPLEQRCIQQAIEVYKYLKPRNLLIGLADILIGATALYYRIPLATTNEKHFSRIPHLNLVDLSLDRS